MAALTVWHGNQPAEVEEVQTTQSVEQTHDVRQRRSWALGIGFGISKASKIVSFHRHGDES